MNVVLYHLFPDLLNLYGDYGNIITLKHHLESLGVNVEYKKIDNIKQFDKNECSFLLIGGGSDREQSIATKQLSLIKEELEYLIENNLPILAVCGGYQFLGKYYECLDGTILNGLDIFDITTKATDTRMVGNIVINTEYGKIVGFENHSGETFHNYDTLGEVVVGFGNTLAKSNEGFMFNSVIGTYMHGPLLPKNSPLISWFIKRICSYEGINLSVDDLDFEFEDLARMKLIDKLT